MKLFLIRHGEIAGDPYIEPSRPVTGCLSPRGVQQARQLGTALADEDIDLVICSSYGRAIQTAEEAMRGRDVPFIIRDFLKEWLPSPSVRESTSTAFEAIVKQNNGLPAEQTWKTDLGEGVFDMYARIAPNFVKLMAELGIHARDGGYVFEEDADQTIAIFAHGGSLNILLSFLLRLPPFPVGAFGFELTGMARVVFSEKAGVWYPMLRFSAPVNRNTETSSESYITEDSTVTA